jgi:GNAT superfamily N-acetyltransferase
VVAELNIANGENLMINQSPTEKTLEILEAPSIPGLKFRYFQGESDYPKMKDTFDACKDVDQIEHTLTIEAIANNYEHLQRCDPFTDTIFAEVDGQPIGYSRVGWYPGGEGDYIYYSLGWIKPEWRRKGVGTAILKHNERRIREIAADESVLMFREMGFDETALGVDTQNCNQALNLYEGVGYWVVRKGTVCRKQLQ